MLHLHDLAQAAGVPGVIRAGAHHDSLRAGHAVLRRARQLWAGHRGRQLSAHRGARLLRLCLLHAQQVPVLRLRRQRKVVQQTAPCSCTCAQSSSSPAIPCWKRWHLHAGSASCQGSRMLAAMPGATPCVEAELLFVRSSGPCLRQPAEIPDGRKGVQSPRHRCSQCSIT